MKLYDLRSLKSDHVNSAYHRQAVYGDALTVAKVTVESGEITQAHSHDTEEVIYVLKGKWLFRLPDEEVVVGEDQMLCIPAGIEHSSEALEDTVALDICSKNRADWQSGQDRVLHNDPEKFLWAV